MKWYDMVAPLYDRAISRTYLPYRQIAVQALHLQPCLTVMDIGCGTGYWTQRISETAKSIVGIDINEAVLEIARSKEYGCPTEYRVMDAYNMDFGETKFNGAIASFMLSHVLKQDIPRGLRLYLPVRWALLLYPQLLQNDKFLLLAGALLLHKILT